MVLAGPHTCAHHLHAAGVVHPAGGGGDLLPGRAARRADAGGPAVRARGQRGAAGVRGRPSCRCRRRRAPALAVVSGPRRPRGADARDQGQRPADRRRHGPHRRRPRGHRDVGRGVCGRRPADRCLPDREGQAAAVGQVHRLRVVGPTLVAGDPRPGRRRAGGGSAHRLGGHAQRAARLPRRLLGAGRRRGPGRRRASAGRTLRAVSHAPGRRAVRAAGNRRQGTDRTGIRRPHVLGHRGVRAAGSDLHRAAVRGRRTALAPVDARPGTRARGSARPEGLGVSVAHDPRAGVLGLLAGGDGGVPRQRRHRRCGGPALVRHRRRRVRAQRRPRAVGRDRAAVALAGSPRHGGTLPNRRRHRSRRVQRAGRQQRLYEPDGPGQPAVQPPTRPNATAPGRRRSGSTTRSSLRGATRPTTC